MIKEVEILDIDKLLQSLPTRRIKPMDGLAITSGVWEEAHEYHRLRQQFHNLLGHGPGILTGLEVIASEPPDASVYVMPGVAIGHNGEFIILEESVAYDLGAAQGSLHLLLTYGESGPHAEQEPGGVSEILRVHAAFGIEARPILAGETGVELARIRRSDRNAVLLDAQVPQSPGVDEIDLRFRRQVGGAPASVASVALCYAGDAVEGHARGAQALARAMRHEGVISLWVDADLPIDEDLQAYTLVYLVGWGDFQLSTDEMTALYNYLQEGGTLFYESCRVEDGGKADAADEGFLDMVESFGMTLDAPGQDHPLFNKPYLFATPPAGASESGEGQLLTGEGIVFSTYDYGCLWQGQSAGSPPTRGRIRAAHEWGHNLVTYALGGRGESDT